MSNSLNESMNRMSMPMTMTGGSSGRVMCHKVCQADAPSTSAASYISGEIGLQAGQDDQDDERRPLPDVGDDDGDRAILGSAIQAKPRQCPPVAAG